METIEEPASTIYGHLFEHSAIKEWVRNRGTCPLTKKPLREDQIIPQYGLKATRDEMRKMKQQNEAGEARIRELEAQLAASQSQA